MEPPPQQEEVGDPDEGEGVGSRRRQMCQDGEVPRCKSDVRPIGTAENLQGTNRQERPCDEVEDRVGGP